MSGIIYIPRLAAYSGSPEDMIAEALLHGSLEAKQMAMIADELHEAVRELQLQKDQLITLLERNDISNPFNEGDLTQPLPMEWA